ncbi:hypothetical protein L2E82_47860 [Cichorium intybus]|uniref:Uncharacterized protein n=1 Tax=Cichorium intybus TaxID=13427 RepID=A0ACB8Z0T9_CICIN|nr:hypothetical protein L2E82_47860 [Cichorium intybus]
MCSSTWTVNRIGKRIKERRNETVTEKYENRNDNVNEGSEIGNPLHQIAPAGCQTVKSEAIGKECNASRREGNEQRCQPEEERLSVTPKGATAFGGKHRRRETLPSVTTAKRMKHFDK